MKILITGDGGFIGRHLRKDLSAMGHEAIGLSDYCREKGLTVPRFGDSLLWILEKMGPEGIVHCALKRHDPDGEENLRGTTAWAAECRQFDGLRQVFISSISAGSVSSAYGRSKLALERMFSDLGAVSLRLGLVLGDGGVFATISGLLRRFHGFPLLKGGRNPVYPLLVTYLSVAVDRAFREFSTLGGQVKSLYEPGELTMKKMLSLTAEEMRICYVGLPCPYWLLWLPVRMLELMLGDKSPVTRDNLLGLQGGSTPRQESWLDELLPRRPSVRDQIAAALAMMNH